MSQALDDLYTPAPARKDAFMRLVQKLENGCWEYLGTKEKLHNRGRFRLGKNKVLAHHAAWRIFKGERPKDKQAHHTCLNGTCVNPEHLVMLTPAEHRAEHNRIKAEASE